MKRLLIVCLPLICVMFSAGCTTHMWLTESRIWPVNPRFRIIPSTNTIEYMNSGLEFDVVYTRALFTAGGFNYLRFWSNGRVLIRPTDRRPMLQDVESFTNAYVGYYRVEGDIVSCEVFLPAGSPPWACGYELVKSRIETNGLHELSASFNGCRPKDLRKYNIRFGKQPMPGMKRQPDW